MITHPQPVTERIMALLTHLGIERAHVAGRSMSDLQELITVQLQAIASLALICPAFLPLHALEPLQDQLLLFTGDQPFDGERTINALSHLPRCTSEIVVGYTSLLWSDIVADCTDRLETALRQFLIQGTVPFAAGRYDEVRMAEPTLQVSRGMENMPRSTTRLPVRACHFSCSRWGWHLRGGNRWSSS